MYSNEPKQKVIALGMSVKAVRFDENVVNNNVTD